MRKKILSPTSTGPPRHGGRALFESGEGCGGKGTSITGSICIVDEPVGFSAAQELFKELRNELSGAATLPSAETADANAANVASLAACEEKEKPCGQQRQQSLAHRRAGAGEERHGLVQSAWLV
jgi:hypothetical protein